MVPALTLAALLLVAFTWRWHLRRRPGPGGRVGRRLMPEALVRVGFDDAGIVCSYPDGAFRKANWSEVSEVQVHTTSDGPWLADAFWGIHTSAPHPAIVFPGGALGEPELLQALQQRLLGFDNQALAQAMGCTSDQAFVLWRAAAASPPTSPPPSATR